MTLHDLNFWQGFVFGLVVGCLLGIGVMVIFGKSGAKKEDLLAWTIAIVWLIWHVIAGFTGLISTPPNMFDIVSGGAVGFVLGEKFFDYFNAFRK